MPLGRRDYFLSSIYVMHILKRADTINKTFLHNVPLDGKLQDIPS